MGGRAVVGQWWVPGEQHRSDWRGSSGSCSCSRCGCGRTTHSSGYNTQQVRCRENEDQDGPGVPKVRGMSEHVRGGGQVL